MPSPWPARRCLASTTNSFRPETPDTVPGGWPGVDAGHRLEQLIARGARLSLTCLNCLGRRTTKRTAARSARPGPEPVEPVKQQRPVRQFGQVVVHGLVARRLAASTRSVTSCRLLMTPRTRVVDQVVVSSRRSANHRRCAQRHRTDRVPTPGRARRTFRWPWPRRQVDQRA